MYPHSNPNLPPGSAAPLIRSASAGPPNYPAHSLPPSSMYTGPTGPQSQLGLHGSHAPNLYHPQMNGEPPREMPRPGPHPPQASIEPYHQSSIRKSPSVKSLGSQYEQSQSLPPVPPFPGGHPPNANFLSRTDSQGSLHAPQLRSMLPSLHGSSRAPSMVDSNFADPSPPGSPINETPQIQGPVTSKISAEMKCKVFFQQQHAQWKALGSARLKLYRQDPTNIKQLVVKAEKDKSVIISTIVLTDGVERVGKTGVAIELSDQGTRTGIIYMIQCRNEELAVNLFGRLLEGSDRATIR